MTAQVISGLLITGGDAEKLALALDDYARLSWQRGKRLRLDLVQLRNQMAEYATYAGTYVDASPDAPAPVDDAQSGLGVVDTATAAKLLNITEAGVRDLCRRNRLVAMRIQGRWWIAPASIAERKARIEKDTDAQIA